MIAIVHFTYSQLHAPALNVELMDNDAERYCNCTDICSMLVASIQKVCNVEEKILGQTLLSISHDQWTTS